MIYDAPGLHIGVLQSPVYHVIVWHELRPCSYFMKFSLCYNSEFSSELISVFVSIIIWAIYDFALQDFENLKPGPDWIYSMWCGIRQNVRVRIWALQRRRRKLFLSKIYYFAKSENEIWNKNFYSPSVCLNSSVLLWAMNLFILMRRVQLVIRALRYKIFSLIHNKYYQISAIRDREFWM